MLSIVYQKALLSDCSVIYININGYNANGQSYSLFMQKKDSNERRSMLTILPWIGDALYGLMNTQLNVEHV